MDGAVGRLAKAKVKSLSFIGLHYCPASILGDEPAVRMFCDGFCSGYIAHGESAVHAKPTL